ncbi:MAG: SMC-Scp complex subunit ScpB [Gammaproteobacteria bacterium]|nr:SMC-Scp complex subunit ScpB [Gammaproteobacteria bacterium]
MDKLFCSHIIEAALFTADKPLDKQKIKRLFDEGREPDSSLIDEAIELIEARFETSAMMLQRVASGWRFTARDEVLPYISRMVEERPQKYSRALLETLALIAYRQPITRGEIEDVRGVAVSSNIIRTLTERGWVKEVGHKEVPGRPALFGTTPAFLDYFNLTSLSQLPSLNDIRDIDEIGRDVFGLPDGGDSAEVAQDDYTSVFTEEPLNEGDSRETLLETKVESILSDSLQLEEEKA